MMMMMCKFIRMGSQTETTANTQVCNYKFIDLSSQTGFVDIKVLSSSESGIPLWDSYELDEKDGQPIDLASLYMEATKPPSK